MIVRADKAVSFLIEFPSGHPDGNIAWTLRGPDNAILANGSLVVPAGAVSINLPVSATYNHLNTGTLNSYRDLDWTYLVGGAIVNGEVRYSVEARVPFGASADGVRTKLGIDNVIDLPDDEISLVKAYKSFSAAVPADLLSAIDPTNLVVREAIESIAALSLLPSLMVRLAKKEDSGTSSFERQAIKWDELAGYLNGLVYDGYLLVNPLYDPTDGFGAIFILASPESDAFTGV